MKKMLSHIEILPEWSKIAVCLLSSMALGVMDYFTGDFSLTLVYILPIALAAWIMRTRHALFISLFCGVELYVIDIMVTPAPVNLLSIRSWNAFMEVCVLLLTGVLLSKMRSEMEDSRKKSLELEATNRELETFNYSVAHDLRSPLIWIGGYSRSLLKHEGERLAIKHRTNLQEIIKGVTRMERHIDALLNFSRVTREELQRELVDLTEIASSITDELRRTAPTRQVTFIIGENVVVNGDRQLLTAVLQNLVGNAWKYTGKKQEAIIEFGAMSRSGNSVYYVKDNGPGLNPTSGEKIFIPFQRLPETIEFEGSGIGLATVQRIIHRHGGTIWAEATPGSGATFYFTVAPDTAQ